MTVLNIKLEPASHGRWSVSGAVEIHDSAQPTYDAIRALAASGAAQPRDLVRAVWSGSPISVQVSKVLGYEPSPAARAAGHHGSGSHFRANGL